MNKSNKKDMVVNELKYPDQINEISEFKFVSMEMTSKRSTMTLEETSKLVRGHQAQEEPRIDI